MTKREILQRIYKAFGKYTFIEDGHYYLCNGKRVDISTTGLISQYENEFDKDGISKQKALELNISQEELLEQWRIENLHSTIKGSLVHLYAQSLWEHEDIEFAYSSIPEEINLRRFVAEVDILKKQADNFYNDYEHIYELIGCEVYLGDEDYDECGATDIIFLNKYTNEIVIADFKTNKEIKRESYKHKKMLVPLHKLDDCNYSHYSLQLNAYKYKFEKNTGLKVAKTFIVYFNVNADNYEIIEPLNVENEIKKIYEIRRANKMAKMLLIIGEAGSGKTSSLRNLSPKEHYYIDCDKKGLNYKGWKNDYSEENKNYFKTNDGDTVIKLLKNISEKAPNVKYITIDTINSIMIADEMRRAKDKNFDKWTDLATCIYNIVDVVPDLRDDLTVIFIGHTQTEEDGFVRLLTNGKKLNKIGLEKYFNTVLLAKGMDGKYVFETRANNSTARTPMGAFDELEIDNDIVKVLEVLKEY